MTINTGYYNISGTYIYKDSELTLSLKDCNGEDNLFRFELKAEKDSCIMNYIQEENGDPYDPAGLMCGYMMHDLNYYGQYQLKKGEKPVPASAEDISGAWKRLYNSPDDPTDDNIFLFGSDYVCAFCCNDMERIRGVFDLGRFKPLSDDGEIMINLYEDKLFCTLETDSIPLVLERYEEENSLSEADFNGYYYIYSEDAKGMHDGRLYLKDGKGDYISESDSTSTEININNNGVDLTFGGKTTRYDHYYILDESFLSNRYIYLLNDDNYVCLCGDISDFSAAED